MHQPTFAMIFISLSRWLDIPKIGKTSFYLPSLGGFGLTLSEIAKVKTIKHLISRAEKMSYKTSCSGLITLTSGNKVA